MTARREYVKVVSFETSLRFKRWCGEDNGYKCIEDLVVITTEQSWLLEEKEGS